MTDLLKPDLWKTLQKKYTGTDLPKTFDLEPKEDEEIILSTDHGEELIKENLVNPRGVKPTKTVDKFFKEFGK